MTTRINPMWDKYFGSKAPVNSEIGKYVIEFSRAYIEEHGPEPRLRNDNPQSPPPRPAPGM